jgi:hypothetical protein
VVVLRSKLLLDMFSDNAEPAPPRPPRTRFPPVGDFDEMHAPKNPRGSNKSRKRAPNACNDPHHLRAAVKPSHGRKLPRPSHELP